MYFYTMFPIHCKQGLLHHVNSFQHKCINICKTSLTISLSIFQWSMNRSLRNDIKMLLLHMQEGMIWMRTLLIWKRTLFSCGTQSHDLTEQSHQLQYFTTHTTWWNHWTITENSNKYKKQTNKLKPEINLRNNIPWCLLATHTPSRRSNLKY